MVTGAATGIGKCIALAREGATAVAAEISATGVTMDVAAE